MTKETKRCEQCDGLFVPGKPWARYCGPLCRLQAHRQHARESADSFALEHAMRQAIEALRSGEGVTPALESVRAELDRWNGVSGGDGSLLQRFEAATEAGHAARDIASAIGLTSGAVLSRWRGGGALSSDTAERLRAWLKRHGF